MALLNLLSPRAGVEITRSISYGEGPRHALDVYRHAANRARRRWSCSSTAASWQRGNKAIYRFLGSALARRGYVAVIADYRLYPEVLYPEFLDDGARAVRWTKDNMPRFGGDRRRIFVMGHSAGAYIAAMLAIDGRWLAKVGLAPGAESAGLIGVAGPYDFLPLHGETLKAIFNGGNDPQTQPITHVTARRAARAADDRRRRRILVDPGNSTRLAARLREAGNEATVIAYPRTGHL